MVMVWETVLLLYGCDCDDRQCHYGVIALNMYGDNTQCILFLKVSLWIWYCHNHSKCLNVKSSFLPLEYSYLNRRSSLVTYCLLDQCNMFHQMSTLYCLALFCFCWFLFPSVPMWSIYPYFSGLFHWHRDNHVIIEIILNGKLAPTKHHKTPQTINSVHISWDMQ